MAVKTEVARKIVGQLVRDSYDQVYGRILGVSAGPQTTVPHVLIARSNGDIANCPSSEILVDGDSLVLNTSWMERATRLSQDINTILQKISVLNKLYTKGEAVQHIYEKIQERYDTALQSLLERRQQLFTHAEDRLDVLSTRVDRIEVLLVNVKVERSLEYVDVEAYNTTYEALHELLAKTLREKTEVQATLTELTEAAIPPESSTSPEAKREKPLIQSIPLHVQAAGL